jgi:hypothetical protein
MMKESLGATAFSTTVTDPVSCAPSSNPLEGPCTGGLANPSAYAAAPRFIRFRDAPKYLGMDKNRFNREVRPALIHLPIGVQGVAFDRGAAPI